MEMIEGAGIFTRQDMSNSGSTEGHGHGSIHLDLQMEKQDFILCLM